MVAELDKVKCVESEMTLFEAAESYVNMKRHVLSPRTVKEYVETARRFPEWFSSLPVSDITQIHNELPRSKLRGIEAPRSSHIVP